MKHYAWVKIVLIGANAILLLVFDTLSFMLRYFLLVDQNTK